MKTILVSLFLFLLATTAFNQTACPEFDGAWMYDLPDQEGMFFGANGHVIWIVLPNDRGPLGEGASQAAKARAYEGLNVNSGTWTCDGKRGTVTYTYTTDPSLAGTSFSFDYELEGDLERWWVVEPDGSRGWGGRAHKVSDLKPVDTYNCDYPNGIWRYDMPDIEGHFAIAGNYFAWIIIQKDFWRGSVDLSTEAGKAEAFDAIIAEAGTFSCDHKGYYFWNRTLASHPAVSTQKTGERPAFRWRYHPVVAGG